MKEYLSVAYNMKQGDLLPSNETIDKLISLVGNKRQVLCIGIATLPLAKTLSDQLSCSVTVIVEPSDYLTEPTPPGITIITDAIASSEITKRFKPDDFDVVVLADALNQIKDYSNVVAQILSYFSGAIVISVPQLFDNKQSLINAQSREIDRLKQLLRTKDESLSWYAKRFREHLVNHYKLEKTAKERIDYEKETAGKINELSERLRLKEHAYNLLHADRDRMVEAFNIVTRYSVDRLPKIFRYPLKACIAFFTYGPLEPIRILKKKAPSALPHK